MSSSPSSKNNNDQIQYPHVKSENLNKMSDTKSNFTSKGNSETNLPQIKKTGLEKYYKLY